MDARPYSGQAEDMPPAAPSPLNRLAGAIENAGITRPREGRVLSGVCAGIARRYGLDPVLVRVGFVVASLVMTIGLTVYLIATLLLPGPGGQMPLLRALREHEPKSLAALVVLLLMFLGDGVLGSDAGWTRSMGALTLSGLLIWLLLAYGPGAQNQQPSPAGGAFSPASQEAPSSARTAAAGLVFDPQTGRWNPPAPPPGTGTAPSPAAGTPPVTPAPPVPEPSAAARLLPIITISAALVAGYGTYLLLRALPGESGHDAGYGAAAALATLGAFAVVNGLRGVRNRTAILCVIPLLAVSALATAPGSPARFNIEHLPSQTSLRAGQWSDTTVNVTLAPASVNELVGEYSLGAGNLELNLTSIPAAQLATVAGEEISVQAGAGDVILRLPAGVPATVYATADAGRVVSAQPDSQGRHGTVADGIAHDQVTLRYGTGTPQLVINADVGIGTITIYREQR